MGGPGCSWEIRRAAWRPKGRMKTTTTFQVLPTGSQVLLGLHAMSTDSHCLGQKTNPDEEGLSFQN